MSNYPSGDDSQPINDLQGQPRKVSRYGRAGLFLLDGILILAIILVCELLGIWVVTTRFINPVNNKNYTTWTRKIDGMLMVEVPAGSFQMGSERGDDNEKPVHRVKLDTFWIDQTDVTNAEYAMCVSSGECKPPEGANFDPSARNYEKPQYGNYPVINVSWNQANTYCKWAWARLPTEAEWEKAARGTDERTYPWGELIDKTYANYGLYYRGSSAVCSYPKGNSPYGACDMAGNVRQWTADRYSLDYYTISPVINPTGPTTGDSRVVRGGSWGDDQDNLNSAHRLGYPSSGTDSAIGFRCASLVVPQKTTEFFLAPGIFGFAFPTLQGN